MAASDTVSAGRGFRLPFALRSERRLTQPKWLAPATSIGALIVALVIGGIVIYAAGGQPWASYRYIVKAAFGSVGQFNDTLVRTAPLLLVGVACALAFRMRLWNIGAEGQLVLGAWGASAIVLAPVVSATAPRWLMLLTMTVAGFVCGAVWAFIPGYLRARFKVNEIITTLMMNYIAQFWILFWVFGAWSEAGFQMTPTFPRNAWLPRLSDFASAFKPFSGLTLHMGIVFGLIAAVVVYFIVYRSKWGYELRLIGDNPRAATYAGVNIVRNTVLTMMVSGGIAGLAGMAEISGVTHRLQTTVSSGYGFTGIIIAWLAKLNPFAVVLVSILFGALAQAGREIQPSGVPRMLQGIILFCVIASDVLLRYRVRIVRR